MSGGCAVTTMADLRGVIRIAKAASLGVTGNAPRIERAERALEAVTTLRDKAAALADTITFRIDDPRAVMLDDLQAAIAAVGGAA